MLRSRPVTLLAAAAVGVLLIAGLAVHGVGGGVMLALVVGVLVVLSAATWPHLDGRGRAMRVVVVAAVTALAVAKLVGAL